MKIKRKLREYLLMFLILSGIGQIFADSEIYNFEWGRQFGTTGNDQLTNIIVDQSGNSYVTGFSDQELYESESGIYLAKYDSEGNFVWGNQLGYNYSYDMAFDHSGNILITGYSVYGPDGCNQNFSEGVNFVAKYTSDASFIWCERFGDPYSYDTSYSISIDQNDAVIVTGTTSHGLTSSSGCSQYCGFIVKYDQDGNWVWSNEIIANGQDFSDYANAYDVSVDSAGNAYVVGSTNGLVFGETIDKDGTYYDGFVAKYDGSNGQLIWGKQIGTSGSEFAYSVEVFENEVIVGGYTSGSFFSTAIGGYGDIFLAKYNIEDGSLNQGIQTGSAGLDYLEQISIDNEGNIYGVGWGNIGEMTEGYTGFLAKFDPSLNLKWYSNIFSDAVTSTYKRTIFVDSHQNIYFGGSVNKKVFTDNDNGSLDAAFGMYSLYNPSSPDLTFGTSTAMETCKSGPRGNVKACSLSLNFSVQNAGDVSAQNIGVDFYLSSDDTIDSGDTLLDTILIDNIDSNGFYEYNFSTKYVNKTNLNKYIIAIVDKTNDVVESNENNNTIPVKITN